MKLVIKQVVPDSFTILNQLKSTVALEATRLSKKAQAGTSLKPGEVKSLVDLTNALKGINNELRIVRSEDFIESLSDDDKIKLLKKLNNLQIEEGTPDED